MFRDEPAKQRVNVQSINFDDCVFNEKFYFPDYARDEDKAEFRSNQKLQLSRFFEANKILIYQMAAYITGQYDDAVFMVGSSRQSIYYDAINPHSSRGVESCYPFLEALCARVAKLAEQGDKFRVDAYLLADTYGNKPFGSNMKAGLSNTKDFQYDEWLPDTSKLTVLYAQMHKIASENSAAEVVFDYYSHDKAVLDKLHVFFENNPDLMPGNLRLRLHEYDGNRIIHKPAVNGKGGIDYNFSQNILFMVRCAGIDTAVTFENHVMDGLLQHGIHHFRRNRKLMTEVVGPLSSNIGVLSANNIEPGVFNPDSYLSGLRHQIGLLREDLQGDASQKQRDFIRALDNLRHLCHEEVVTQAKFNVSPGLIEKSEAMRVANYTEEFIQQLRAEQDDAQKMQLVNDYHKKCYKTSTRKKILKIVACVVAGALGFLVGGAIGLGIGVGAGAFLGPGAGVTGLAGMLTGAAAGTKVGLAVGATLAGATAGGLTAFGLFKRSKVQQYADRVVDEAAKIYQPPEEVNYYGFSL